MAKALSVNEEGLADAMAGETPAIRKPGRGCYTPREPLPITAEVRFR